MAYFLWLYVRPIVTPIGIVGNSVLLLTIHRGNLNESPYVYLRCIALAGLILLVGVLGLAIASCQTCQYSFETEYYMRVYHL